MVQKEVEPNSAIRLFELCPVEKSDAQFEDREASMLDSLFLNRNFRFSSMAIS